MVTAIPEPKLAQGQKNRILLLVSSPLIRENEDGAVTPVPELQLQEELDAINEALELYNDKFGFVIDIRYATIEHVFDALSPANPAAILHFLGHGSIDDDAISLVLEDSTGRAYDLSANELKERLDPSSPPCILAVLNACHSAGLADALLDAGVHHVVAVNSEETILDRVSRTFARAFYVSLLKRNKVGKAFTDAQTHVFNDPALSQASKKAKNRTGLLLQLLPLGAPSHSSIFHLEPSERISIATRASPSNILETNSEPIVGRQIAMHEILSRCETDAEQRCLFIKGMGGMGKSVLAQAIGRWYRDRGRWKDGVWWVELRGVATIPDAQARIATALGIKNTLETTDLVLTHWLHQKKAVLILDDLDALLDSASAKTEIQEALGRLISGLLSCRRIALIVTSRYDPPAWGGVPYEVKHLDLTAATKLFLQLSRAPSEWMTGPRAHDDLKYVLNFLDGFPLPVKLAAVYMRNARCTISQLAERLRSSPRKVLGGSSISKSRDTSLYVTLDISFDILPEAMKDIFPKVGLFPSGLTSQTAKGILGATAEGLLEGMVSYSMLEVTNVENSRRYSVPEPARAYAVDKLRRDDNACLSRSALEWYCGLLAEINLALLSDDQATSSNARAVIVRELPNIKFFTTWGLNQEDSRDHICWSARCVALQTTYMRLVSPEELGSIQASCQRAQMKAEQAQDTLAHAHVVRALGDIDAGQLRSMEAVSKYLKACKLYANANETLHLAATLRAVGRLYEDEGDYGNAISNYARAADTLKGLGRVLDSARIFERCAALSVKITKPDDWQQYVLQALHLYLGKADQLRAALSTSDYGTAEAAEIAQQSLMVYSHAFELAKQMKDKKTQAVILSNQASIYEQIESWKEAERHYTKSAGIFRELSETSIADSIEIVLNRIKRILAD